MADGEDDVKEILKHCRGEGHLVPMSEVTTDANGRLIHGDHYFPNGNLIHEMGAEEAADTDHIHDDHLA